MDRGIGIDSYSDSIEKMDFSLDSGFDNTHEGIKAPKRGRGRPKSGKSKLSSYE